MIDILPLHLHGDRAVLKSAGSFIPFQSDSSIQHSVDSYFPQLENMVEARASLNFAQAIKDTVRIVDDAQRKAENEAQKVSTGESDDIIGAVLSSQRANLSFLLLMEFRNKVMGAVNNVLEMQL